MWQNFSQIEQRKPLPHDTDKKSSDKKSLAEFDHSFRGSERNFIFTCPQFLFSNSSGLLLIDLDEIFPMQSSQLKKAAKINPKKSHCFT